MALYYSVRVLTNLVCDCHAYRFPHAPFKDNCLVTPPTIEESQNIKVKLSPTAKKKAQDLLSKGYF